MILSGKRFTKYVREQLELEPNQTFFITHGGEPYEPPHASAKMKKVIASSSRWHIWRARFADHDSTMPTTEQVLAVPLVSATKFGRLLAKSWCTRQGIFLDGTVGLSLEVGNEGFYTAIPEVPWRRSTRV